jgi:hypothetical protein
MTARENPRADGYFYSLALVQRSLGKLEMTKMLGHPGQAGVRRTHHRFTPHWGGLLSLKLMEGGVLFT